MVPLLLLLVLPVFSAARLANLLYGEAEPWRRRFAAICLIVPLVYFPILILSTPALLTPWPVIAFHAVLLAVLLFLKPPKIARFAASLQSRASQLAIPNAEGKSPSPESRVPISSAAAWLICIPFVLVAVKHVSKLFTRGSLFFSDDFAYHGFTVSGWFQSHALQHPLLTFAHYYPYNPHVLSFHASLTSPDHQWVWIASLYWVLLAMSAFLALGRLVGGSGIITFAAAGSLFAVSSTVAWVAEKHSPTDLAGAAALLAAFVLMAPRQSAPRREQLASVLLSGMLCGFAVGSKVTNVIPAGVLFVGTFFVLLGSKTPRDWFDAVKGTVLFALGAFSTAFYWYLRNLVLSNNPFFPVRIFGYRGPVQKDRLDPTILWNYLKESPLDLTLWGLTFRGLLHWPYFLGIIAFLGLIAGGGLTVFIAIRVLRTRKLDALGSPLPWLVLAGLAMLVIHFKAPFSGSTLGGRVLDPYQRYIMFVFAVGLASAAWYLAGMTRWRVSQIVVAVFTLMAVVALWGWYREHINELPALILSIVFVVGLLMPLLPFASSSVLGASGGRRTLRPSCFSFLVPPFIVAGVLFALLLRPFYQPGPHPMIDPHRHVVRFEPTRLAIDRLPPGSRIAQLSSRLWEHWTLYGMRSQHYPILLHKDGWPLMDLHVAYQLQHTGGGDLHPRFGVTEPTPPSRPELLAMNLKIARLDYLVFSGFSFSDEAEWPPHHVLFQQIPGWQMIWTDGFSEIYAPEGKHPPGYVLDAPGNLMKVNAQTNTDETRTNTDNIPSLDDQPSSSPDS